MGRRRDEEVKLNLILPYKELTTHYLYHKAAGWHQPIPIVAKIDFYKFDPWDLLEMTLGSNKPLGIKKSLIFHHDKSPIGIKIN